MTSRASFAIRQTKPRPAKSAHVAASRSSFESIPQQCIKTIITSFFRPTVSGWSIRYRRRIRGFPTRSHPLSSENDQHRGWYAKPPANPNATPNGRGEKRCDRDANPNARWACVSFPNRLIHAQQSFRRSSESVHFGSLSNRPCKTVTAAPLSRTRSPASSQPIVPPRDEA